MSFWGAGCTNYGNEMLEMACRFKREYPEALRTAILNNFFVNPSGRKGHWHEMDLEQEHANYWIQAFSTGRTPDFDSPHLKECISPNVQGFNTLRRIGREWFSLASKRNAHKMADLINDLNLLGKHYRKDEVLTFHRQREQPYTVPNEFTSGIEKLRGGVFNEFIARTTTDRSDVHEQMVWTHAHHLLLCLHPIAREHWV